MISRSELYWRYIGPLSLFAFLILLVAGSFWPWAWVGALICLLIHIEWAASGGLPI